MTVSSWSFDGFFRNVKENISLKLPEDKSIKLQITSLEIYPLRFADPQVEQSLRNQGEAFWSCRYRRYINYIKDDEEECVDNVSGV